MNKLGLTVALLWIGCSRITGQVNDKDTVPVSRFLQAEPASVIKFAGIVSKPYRDALPEEVAITFSLYAGQQDIAPLWSETQTVKLDTAGQFSVLLGASRPNGLPPELFAENQARWLGYQIEGVPEATRKMMIGVPYALKAREAESLNGLSAAAFVRWSDLESTPESGRLSFSTLAQPGTGASARAASWGNGSQNKPHLPSTYEKDAYLPGNLLLEPGAYIATADVIANSGPIIPKLLLSAHGGPGGGVVPSITFRSINPRHIFGEVAFQDSTPSPGQDIWAMQQDFQLNHTENLTFRRRGQPVMTFWPLSNTGNDVITVLSGTRFRFERSGPYPLEWRDTSFAFPKGLWRAAISGDCWFLDKNQAVAGDFAEHTPVLETCGDGNLNVAAGLQINGGVRSSSDLNLQASGNVILSTLNSNSIYFSPGPQGYNLFLQPIGIGTSRPEAKLHISGTGNLQEAIIASQADSNEGISIRNAVQNWAMGVRADRSEAFILRNITDGADVLAIARNGDITLAPGAKIIAGDSTVGSPGTPCICNSIKHGRVEIPPLGPGETALVRLDWKTVFADTDYTATCSVTSPSLGEAVRIAHLQDIQPDAVSVVVVNEDSSKSQSGRLNCIAVHD